jgi:hypothetical protein
VTGPAREPEPGAVAPPGEVTAPGQAAASGSSGRRAGASPVLATASYVLLFLFGATQAMIGAFFYAGPLLAPALGFAAGIYASCVFGGWGTRRPAGALAVAAGWLLATLVLASGTSGGTVLITDTGAGKLFLFGGAAAAAAGVITASLVWSSTARKRGRRHKQGQP